MCVRGADMLPRLSLLGFVRGLWRIVTAQPQTPPALVGNPLLATILQRRSVRSFTRQPIPDDVFAAILEAGRLAPSTVNLQTWSFAAFTAETWPATFGRPIPFRGQRALVVLGDTHRAATVLDVFPDSPLVQYTVAVMNASLAAMNMNLAAEALGVSSVMLSETGRSGLLDAGYLQETLGLPAGVVPLTTIVFGYARGARPPMPPKLLVEQVCFEGRYVEPDAAVMQSWLEQMMAGYQASHPGAAFEDQLRVYAGKIDSAERDLRRMVFGDKND
jgi:nitroreductase